MSKARNEYYEFVKNEMDNEDNVICIYVKELEHKVETYKNNILKGLEKILQLEHQNEELIDIMSEMADYLNRNKLNYIGSGSIFNQQMNEAIQKYGADK